MDLGWAQVASAAAGYGSFKGFNHILYLDEG